MKRNSVSFRDASHLRARRVSHRNRLYPIFEGLPAELQVKGTVVIKGPVFSGKTLAMLRALLCLVRNTPAPYHGKKHLMVVDTDSNDTSFYGILVALIREEPSFTLRRTHERVVRDYLATYGFDLLVRDAWKNTGYQFDNRIKSKYEVVHYLTEGHPAVFEPGVPVSTICASVSQTGVTVFVRPAIERDGVNPGMATTIQPMKLLFWASMVFATSADKDAGVLKLTLEKCKHWATGAVFELPGHPRLDIPRLYPRYVPNNPESSHE